jgi:hypothetical protein
MGRISISATLGWVVAFALGLAALVNASVLWAGAVLHLTLFALLAGVVGAILKGRRGGDWLGFALFGCPYFFLLMLPGIGDTIRMTADPVSTWAFEKANRRPELPETGVLSPAIPTPAPAYGVQLPPMDPPPSPPDVPSSPEEPSPSPIRPRASPDALPPSEPSSDLATILPPPTPPATLLPPPSPPMLVGAPGMSPGRPTSPPDPMEDYQEALQLYAARAERARNIGGLLMVLAFAGLGAIVGRFLARERSAEATPATSDRPSRSIPGPE